MAQYYWALRSVIKEHPHLKKCLTRCKHCQIYFFTHPRNAGRSDIGCPFGCREAHKRQKSNQRSTSYYQTPEGKVKKKTVNDRRNSSNIGSSPPRDVDELKKMPIVLYIKMVAELIEGKDVALDRILRLLRQHPIFKRLKNRYKDYYAFERPP